MKVKVKESGEVILNTDDYTIYSGICEIEKVLEHRVVNHSKRRYEEGGVHIHVRTGTVL